MASRTSLSSSISSYYLTVLVAFLMTAVIATPMATPELTDKERNTSGRADYWSLGTVSFPDDAGMHNSIAIDDDGVMHIAHINPTNGELLYSTNTTNTTWSTTNFTFSNVSQLGVQGKTAIAINSNGDVNIAYRMPNSQNSSAFDLKHVVEIQNGWSMMTVSTGRDMGHHLSMAIDSSDVVHIAYRDNTNGKLRYAVNEASCYWCWEDDVVTMSTGSEVAGGHHTSIVTDANKEPIIAHCNSPNGSLMLLETNPSGSFWSMTYPDGQANGCKHTSMGIYTPAAGGEELHISYARDEDSDGDSELRYTTRSSTGSWNGHTIEGSGLGSTSMRGMTSLTVDSVGAVHIAYSGNYVDSEDPADLKYALKPSISGSYWSTEVVTTDTTYYVSIDVDSNDIPYTSYLKTCGPTCSELAYAIMVYDIQLSQSVNSNPYYADDKLIGSWNGTELAPGKDYSVYFEFWMDEGTLIEDGFHNWTQPSGETEKMSNSMWWGNLTEGETYCLKIVLDDEEETLSSDTTCVTIPHSESITSQAYFDTDAERLYFDYYADNLVSDTTYRVYYAVLQNETLVAGNHGAGTITPTNSATNYSGTHGYEPLTVSWMNSGETYCVYFEITYPEDGSGNVDYDLLFDHDETCVTIPYTESITSQLNFDEGAERLWANFSAAGLTNGSQYVVNFILTDSGNMTISSGNQTIYPAGLTWTGNFGSWPLNLSWMDLGSTYCMRYEIEHPGQSNYISFDESCVTIPSEGGNGGSWTSEFAAVEPGNTGYGSSMAIDDYGYLHVSYYNYENGWSDISLMYGFFNGDDWEIVQLESDLGSASVHSAQLVLEDGFCPAILYYDETNRALKIRYSTPSSNGNIPCDWEEESRVVATETSGTAWNVYAMYSLAIEGNGNNRVTHISYAFYCENEPDWDGDLMYASFDEAVDNVWQYETIATSALTGFHAIELENGNPHIAHYDYGSENKIVYYSYFDGSDWTTETIANDVDLWGSGTILSFELGPNWQNSATVVYVENTTSEMRVATRSGGSWPITGIADTNGGADNSLAFDENGNPNIAYTEGGMSSTDTNDLKFAHYNGQEWTIITIDNGGPEGNRVGFNPSLVYDQQGKPIVAHLDFSAGNLKITCNGCSILDGGSSGSGTDTDGDGIFDSNDICWDGNTGWTSTTTNDYDQDGCFDGTEDWDDDNDGIQDTEDSCYRGDTNWNSWQSEPIIDYDHDGCLDSTEDYDDDQDGITDTSDDCLLTRVGAIVDEFGCETSFPDDDDDGVANSYDQCADSPPGEDVDWYGCRMWYDDDNDGVHNDDDDCENTPPGDVVDSFGCTVDSELGEPEIFAHLTQMDDNDLDVDYTVANLSSNEYYSVEWSLKAVDYVCSNPNGELDLPSDDFGKDLQPSSFNISSSSEGENQVENGYRLVMLTESQYNFGEYCLQITLYENGNVVSTTTNLIQTTDQRDDDEDGVSNGEDECPDTPEYTAVDLVGCAIVNSIDEEADWWVEIPLIGTVIEQIQTEYGRYISMATVGLAILGWAYRAVTMRSEYKMEKRCKKFEKRIDRATSASQLRDIQVEIEKAQKKRLIERGAYGDLLSRIEMRAEDLGLTDFITNDALVEAGISEMELRSGIEDLRAARMELDMDREEFERSRYSDSRSRDTKIRGATNLSEMVTGEKLEGSGRGSMRRSSYHPMDINQDGVVDEEDDRLWNAMSEEERQSRIAASKKQDVNLVSEIVAFSKIPNGPKARCNCGSGKQFAKCHMKKIRCPCGSGRTFVRCCAKKRGYR